MPQCGYLVHNQKDEPNILNQLSINSKNPSTINMLSKREKPNVSKSIIHKSKHSSNYVSTNLQKPTQVKTVKDNI